MKNTPARYNPLAMSFHWLIALAIVALLIVGAFMTDMPNTPNKFFVYGLHKSIGLTVLFLAALRLLWRFTNPAPMLPAGTPMWQKALAHGTHLALYGLMFFMPLSGWLMSDAAGYHPTLFGLSVPVLTQPNPWLKDVFKESHELGANLLWLFLAGHVAAALYHHVYVKDDILQRMLPVWLKIPRPRLFGLTLATLALCSGAAFAAVPAPEWKINPTFSKLEWKSAFNGAPVKGYFKRWSGKILFSPSNLEGSSISVKVDVASIDSADKTRDEVIKSAEWFNTSKFPAATFTSAKITENPQGYVASGTLTMLGISKQVNLPFKLKIHSGNATATGSLTVSRNSFGLGKGEWQNNPSVQDLVQISFSVNASQVK